MDTEQMISEIRALIESGNASTYEYIDREDGQLVNILDMEIRNDRVFITYSTFPGGDKGGFTLNRCPDEYIADVYNAVKAGKRDKNLFH